MRLIKRYKNRTFYDTENRKVITIDEIARLVNSGLEIKVIDNVTGKDITVQTLAWALSNKCDNDSKNDDNVIIQLLLKRGANVMDVAKKLMLAAIGAVNLSKEKAEEMMDELVKKGEMTQTEKSEALKKMEAERRPLYLAAADAVIPNSGTVEDAVTAAMEALDEIFSH